MNKYKYLNTFLFIILVVFIGSCLIKGEEECIPPNKPANHFVIDTGIHYQTIDHFGASDAWTVQNIGLWPEEKQHQMASWLFSTENDELGNPQGIGLSLWRFYIGAGSKEQGANSKINNPERRAECFLQPNGIYNWNKHKGQRNFMQLSKQQGVNQFLGFIYSPPVYWTQNGLATNSGRGGTFNLTDDKYDDFASYIADIVIGVEKYNGILFDYISPFNEPDGHWNWSESNQEGTPATKYEIAKTVKILSAEFKQRNISTQIIVPESSDYHCMISTHPKSDYTRGYQIQSYFSEDSTTTYLGNESNVPHLLAAHSYWTNTPLSDLMEIRKEIGELTKLNKIGFWMTELCIMSNDKEIGGGWGKDLSMNTALYVARIIHHDLVFANASAWNWWLAITSGDYKDGLIYTSPDESKLDGTYTDSKLMWTFGNFSRFIRPGARRISISSFDSVGNNIDEGATDPHGLMLSAYKNKDNSIVVVVINYSSEDKKIYLTLKELDVDHWIPYVTSDSTGFNLKKQKPIQCNSQVELSSRSVVTLIGAL